MNTHPHHRSRRRALRCLVAFAALSTLGLAAPQASGASAPVPVAPHASAATRAVASANAAAAVDTAALCGSGMYLERAENLPPNANTLGTLWIYNGSDLNSACAVFTNNTGRAKYMKVKLCSNKIDEGCVQDAGTFSKYAGPVRISGDGVYCSKVTAIMKATAGSTKADIDRVTYATPCN
jgi:hypothetical protein